MRPRTLLPFPPSMNTHPRSKKSVPRSCYRFPAPGAGTNLPGPAIARDEQFITTRERLYLHLHTKKIKKNTQFQKLKLLYCTIVPKAGNNFIKDLKSVRMKKKVKKVENPGNISQGGDIY